MAASPLTSILPPALAAASKTVDAALDHLLPKPHGLHARVHEAMRYATFAGGKRLRPFLVLSSAKLFGVDPARAARVGAAIEVLHTYSLVHDDLPCMDDDDLRRGRPTTHIAFDEMTAVLAGDALLTLAFEICAHPDTHPSGEVRAALCLRLAEASGANGMIGGQMIDMQAAQNAFGSDEVVLLQRLKTGQLFEFSCEAGAILGEAGSEHRDRLRSYARDIGLVFQITDDLLDVTSTAEKTGKAVGKDKDAGKATLVSILGVDGARAEAEKLARRAAATLAPYHNAVPELAQLPLFLLDRES
ncbi:MAG: polyprenyl synthetase family protein [Alphaproteobacteria bacterium]|nr:polyprenyl synthetase family protein [Alphaproteobacteria bacterium]MBV9418662.1 polyprenyl synthetase family protein [Alphaproteobacteria bacterium]MBV9903599.1 polyprenyl synthetase family protein [Alphaproteobacteria bacterium]